MSRKSHKRELFRVAFKMFILKSFDGVSIPDIEKATGFTRGTIFHYADTKLDLFRQVVEYYVLERQDIDRKIQVADDCTLRQFIDTYVKGVERTMEALHEIVGMDVPMRDCSRAYLNMMSQMSVLLPEIHKTFLNAMAKEERLWIEVIGRGVESGELQNDVQPTILAKIMMSLFHGRTFQDTLIDVILTSLILLMKTLFKQMQPLYECVECEGGAKHHRATHGLVVISPLFQEVCRWHKNDAFSDIGRIVNIPHAGEHLAVMTDGLPKFIVVDGRLGKRLVHHLLQVIQVSGLSVGVPTSIGGE